MSASATPFSDALRVGPGFDLSAIDPRSTPAFDGKKKKGRKELAEVNKRLKYRQRQLFADAKEGGHRSLLLAIQGMDTGGKGGIVKHSLGGVDPEGLQIRAFKAPTEEERAHDFLWRIEGALPPAGKIGVFDRTQYEDVLIVRVHNLVPESVWSLRYDQINDWEARVSANGTAIVKVMLNISYEEQRSRLQARLDEGDKHWKYGPGDVDERKLWPQYMEAYQAALTKCSTDAAPWYVIPADRKWYARLAVSHLLVETLDAMGLDWPKVDFDLDAERKRLAAT